MRRVTNSSGHFNQLQYPVDIQVVKQKDGEYRGTLSAEARPLVVFQGNEEKVNYFNEEKGKKVNLIADSGTPLQWISQMTIQHTKRKRSCLQMHGLIS